MSSKGRVGRYSQRGECVMFAQWYTLDSGPDLDCVTLEGYLHSTKDSHHFFCIVVVNLAPSLGRSAKTCKKMFEWSQLIGP